MKKTDRNIMAEGRLEFRRHLPSSIETVWRFLTEDELRGQWLCRGNVASEEGGTIEFDFDPEALGSPRPAGVPADRYTSTFEGTVLTYDPPNLLAFLWPGSEPDQKTRVTMSLREVEGGTELHLIHEHITQDSEMIGAAAGWHAHLEQLECQLSRSLAPNFWNHHVELEAEYKKRLMELRAGS